MCEGCCAYTRTHDEPHVFVMNIRTASAGSMELYCSHPLTLTTVTITQANDNDVDQSSSHLSVHSLTCPEGVHGPWSLPSTNCSHHV